MAGYIELDAPTTTYPTPNKLSECLSPPRGMFMGFEIPLDFVCGSPKIEWRATPVTLPSVQEHLNLDRGEGMTGIAVERSRDLSTTEGLFVVSSGDSPAFVVVWR